MTDRTSSQLLAEQPPHLEEWREVVGSGGWYEVSNTGRVRSWYYAAGMYAPVRASEPRYLGCRLRPDGYYSMQARIEGVKRKLLVHRQVLLAFVGAPPEGKPHCLHGNGVRTDNRLENLRWGSQAENQHDMVLHGKSGVGERNAQARLTEGDVRYIRSSTLPIMELAGRFEVNHNTIRFVLARQTWRHVA